jgi:hypothetical protein
MKKNYLTYCLAQILILYIIITFSGCKKNTNSENGDLLGTWISTDLVDTLDFTSDHDLYKMIDGIVDHYGYSINADSIKIEYSGFQMPYIYIGPPNNRFFQLNGNDLTIDFKSPYYGFRAQIIKFKRK